VLEFTDAAKARAFSSRVIEGIEAFEPEAFTPDASTSADAA